MDSGRLQEIITKGFIDGSANLINLLSSLILPFWNEFGISWVRDHLILIGVLLIALVLGVPLSKRGHKKLFGFVLGVCGIMATLITIYGRK